MKPRDKMALSDDQGSLKTRDVKRRSAFQIDSQSMSRGISLVAAILFAVVLNANEAVAQSPNAALKIEFHVDNSGNADAPKTVGDFQFTVSKLGEAPLFKFHGSEQVITVPVTAASSDRPTPFVL
jgi:hypothetical protein